MKRYISNIDFRLCKMKRFFSITIFLIIAISLAGFEPQWEWGVTLSSFNDFPTGKMVNDSEGNLYITGSFNLTLDFGPHSLEAAGAYDHEIISSKRDVYVAKLDTDGNWCWATRIGGEEEDFSFNIAIDSNDNIYITGCLDKVNLDPSSLPPHNYHSDLFVAKLDSDGNVLWKRRTEGAGDNEGHSIVIDSNDNVYIVGSFSGDIDFGIIELTSYPMNMSIIAKLDTDGDWLWVREFNEKSIGMVDRKALLSIDQNDKLTIAGLFHDTVNFGQFSITAQGFWNDIYIAGINPEGEWLWIRQISQIEPDEYWGHLSLRNITADRKGNIILLGAYNGIVDFGNTYLTSDSNTSIDRDFFLASLDPQKGWNWIRKLARDREDSSSQLHLLDVATDRFSNLYITGSYSSTLTLGDIVLDGDSSTYLFLAKGDPLGNWLWAERSYGWYYSYGISIAVDRRNTIFLRGSFDGQIELGSLVLTSDIFQFASHFYAKLRVKDSEVVVPSHYVINYPNPFNPLTTFLLSMHFDDHVKLKIYNIKGQRVVTILDEYREAGVHRIVWDGRDAAGDIITSGVYLYILSSKSQKITGKMTLMK